MVDEQQEDEKEERSEFDAGDKDQQDGEEEVTAPEKEGQGQPEAGLFHQGDVAGHEIDADRGVEREEGEDEEQRVVFPPQERLRPAPEQQGQERALEGQEKHVGDGIGEQAEELVKPEHGRRIAPAQADFLLGDPAQGRHAVGIQPGGVCLPGPISSLEIPAVHVGPGGDFINRVQEVEAGQGGQDSNQGSMPNGPAPLLLLFVVNRSVFDGDVSASPRKNKFSLIVNGGLARIRVHSALPPFL